MTDVYKQWSDVPDGSDGDRVIFRPVPDTLSNSRGSVLLEYVDAAGDWVAISTLGNLFRVPTVVDGSFYSEFWQETITGNPTTAVTSNGYEVTLTGGNSTDDIWDLRFPFLVDGTARLSCVVEATDFSDSVSASVRFSPGIAETLAPDGWRYDAKSACFSSLWHDGSSSAREYYLFMDDTGSTLTQNDYPNVSANLGGTQRLEVGLTYPVESQSPLQLMARFTETSDDFIDESLSTSAEFFSAFIRLGTSVDPGGTTVVTVEDQYLRI